MSVKAMGTGLVLNHGWTAAQAQSPAHTLLLSAVCWPTGLCVMSTRSTFHLLSGNLPLLMDLSPTSYLMTSLHVYPCPWVGLCVMFELGVWIVRCASSCLVSGPKSHSYAGYVDISVEICTEERLTCLSCNKQKGGNEQNDESSFWYSWVKVLGGFCVVCGFF